MSRFDVVFAGTKYIVVDAEGRQCSGLGQRDAIVRMMERMERAAKLTPRPCLCCGATFASEGAHHRMCGPCRSDASRIDARMLA